MFTININLKTRTEKIFIFYWKAFSREITEIFSKAIIILLVGRYFKIPWVKNFSLLFLYAVKYIFFGIHLIYLNFDGTPINIQA